MGGVKPRDERFDAMLRIPLLAGLLPKLDRSTGFFHGEVSGAWVANVSVWFLLCSGFLFTYGLGAFLLNVDYLCSLSSSLFPASFLFELVEISCMSFKAAFAANSCLLT